MIRGITNIDGRHFTFQDLDMKNPNIRKHMQGYVLLVKAEWCGYCKRYLPAYKKFAEDNQNYQFLMMDADSNADVIHAWSQLVNPIYKADHFPTLIRFDSNGKALGVVENRDDLINELKKPSPKRA